MLFVAGLAAIVGALVWGGITYLTGYEIGYVAWGIGLLIGAAAVKFGGSGSTCGMVCAALALASIFTGKMLAVQFTMPGEIRTLVESQLTQQAYEEMKKDAADSVSLESKEHYARFMVGHEFSEAENAQDVSAEELADFERLTLPKLRRFHSEQPSYQRWREQELSDAVKTAEAILPVTELVVQDLAPIDVIFGLLGIATAYRIPARRTGQEAITS